MENHITIRVTVCDVIIPGLIGIARHLYHDYILKVFYKNNLFLTPLPKCLQLFT